MKLAVLSDIHGNFPALVEVTEQIQKWQPDMVLLAGDIVNRGPLSLECLSYIEDQERLEGWKVIRGNHEDYVIDLANQSIPPNGPRFEFYQPVLFTINQIEQAIPKLKLLPDTVSTVCDNHDEIRLLHASMRHNRDGLYPESSDKVLTDQITPFPKIFITGHTHRPFVREINGTLIVNAGSCGLPFDGDQRASFAKITYQNCRWQAEIIRVEYDIQQAMKDFNSADYLEGAGPLSHVIRLELESALSQLYNWTKLFAKPVLAGEISVEKATKEFLKKPISKPYWYKK